MGMGRKGGRAVGIFRHGNSYSHKHSRLWATIPFRENLGSGVSPHTWTYRAQLLGGGVLVGEVDRWMHWVLTHTLYTSVLNELGTWARWQATAFHVAMAYHSAAPKSSSFIVDISIHGGKRKPGTTRVYRGPPPPPPFLRSLMSISYNCNRPLSCPPFFFLLLYTRAALSSRTPRGPISPLGSEGARNKSSRNWTPKRPNPGATGQDAPPSWTLWRSLSLPDGAMGWAHRPALNLKKLYRSPPSHAHTVPLLVLGPTAQPRGGLLSTPAFAWAPLPLVCVCVCVCERARVCMCLVLPVYPARARPLIFHPRCLLPGGWHPTPARSPRETSASSFVSRRPRGCLSTRVGVPLGLPREGHKETAESIPVHVVILAPKRLPVEPKSLSYLPIRTQSVRQSPPVAGSRAWACRRYQLKLRPRPECLWSVSRRPMRAFGGR